MSIRVSQVLDEKELTDIYRLRYKVYCNEWGFEKPENHPDGLITDIYDKNAVHFAARDDTNRLVGAIMLIVDSPEGFPVEKYCELDIDKDKIPRNRTAEISRLSIHRDYRRREEDKYIYGPDEERRSIGSFNYHNNYTGGRTYFRRSEDRYRHKGARRMNDLPSERRRRHEVLISLYKAVYQESKQRGLSHWYSIMTKGIVMLLGKFGLKFEEIGDPVDYHGIRTPYLVEIRKIEEEMTDRNPDLYEEFSKNL